jgi:hypothetical protein
MNPLAQITASTQTCDELVGLGITPKAFFWHLKENNLWDVWEMEKPPAYRKNECVPAWTMEELAVLLGGDVPAPRLPEMKNVKVEKVGDKKTAYVYEYVFYDIASMRSWRKNFRCQNPGAQSTAEILKIAIQKKWVDVDQCNDRYSQFFNPLENDGKK